MVIRPKKIKRVTTAQCLVIDYTPQKAIAAKFCTI